MKSLDEMINQESNKAFAYVSHNKPFKYIDYLKTTYKVTNSTEQLYNHCLDDYNWLITHGVKHNAVFYTLKRLATQVLIKHFNNYKK